MNYLYYYCIIFFILRGCAAWFPIVDFTFTGYTIVAIITICIWLKCYKGKLRPIPSEMFYLLLSLLVGYYWCTRGDVLSAICSTISDFALCTPLLLKHEDQKKVLRAINKFFFPLITISTFLYLFKMAGLLPSVAEFQRGSYYYNNYYLYIYSSSYEYRNCGICIEPGFYSILLSALLLVNKYDFRKKENKVYGIALLSTLSLGGYILTTVCWYLYYAISNSINKKQILIKSLVFIGGLSLSLYVVKNVWSGGNNIVNEQIVQRLEYDEDKGITGNNRQNDVSKLLWANFLVSDNLYTGLGIKDYRKQYEGESFDSASFAEYVMKYGIIITLLRWLGLALLAFRRNDTIYAIPAFVFLFIDFLQHGYDLELSMFLLVYFFIVYNSDNPIKICKQQSKIHKLV